MEKFDLIVLGGGPAGYLAAERAAQGGLSAAVVEKNSLGGVCLNEGCIPSKALLNSAKIFYSAAHGEKYGVIADGITLDHKTVLARKNKVVKMLVAGVNAKMKKAGVRVIKAQGAITGKTADGFVVAADGEEYAGARLLIATGSVPVLPPIEGLAEGIEAGFCLTNREILSIEEIPDNLTVIGGGVIGLEMAAYFSVAGSKVTVVEMLDKIAGGTDEQLSQILLKELKSKGIEFRLGARVTSIGTDCVCFEENGESVSLGADKVLVSIGRRAFTQGIGLETLGVETQRGAIATNEKMQTNVPGVYAAGDVNGRSMLAHTAYRESEVAVNNILGKDDRMDYSAVPSVIYTSPEVACVGETLASASEKGFDAREISLPMNMSGRYMAEVERGTGSAKIVVENGTNRILGVHLLGSYVSEMIYGAAMIIGQQTDLDTLKKTVFPHPTVSEILRELIFEI